ncbi:MAG: hypothetical protein QOD86_2849 [Miltoncostaeaceae bacterium]|jgi:uncharacterized membrane protein YkgB|nr:hypothetical protein [Miltoncostaeaceae bacterium]
MFTWRGADLPLPSRRGPLRNAPQWFLENATSPPSRLRQALTVVLAVGLTIGAWRQRGAVAGIVAVGVGLVLIAFAFWQAEAAAWSQRHRLLDSLFIAPLLFLLFFLVFGASLILAVAAAAIGAGLLLTVVWSRAPEGT